MLQKNTITIEAKPRPGEGEMNPQEVRWEHQEMGVTVKCISEPRPDTFKEGCNVPGRDPPLLHELSKCNLQEKDWDPSNEHKQQVGDEENT